MPDLDPETRHLSMNRRTTLLLLMFSTGFCSMIYELAMAQFLAALMGNVMGRFATTLGVYVFGLGLGSILFEPKNEKQDGLLFFKAEVALFLVGLASPFLLIGLHRIAGTNPSIVLYGAHLLIFAIGFLSGFELPILASLIGRGETSSDANALSADYIGMFLASVVFPLLLFPYVGLGAALWIATLLNLVAAFVTYRLVGGKSRVPLVALGLLAVVNVAFILKSDLLHSWMSHLYASMG
jgi:spermidine synthase